MKACRLGGVDTPKRGIQFVARRQGSSAVEQPRKVSGLVDVGKLDKQEQFNARVAQR